MSGFSAYVLNTGELLRAAQNYIDKGVSMPLAMQEELLKRLDEEHYAVADQARANKARVVAAASRT